MTVPVDWERIANDSNAMHDDSAHETDPAWEYNEQPASDPIDDFIGAAIPEQDYDQPDAGLLQTKPRSTKAKGYERKTKSILSLAFRLTAQSEATVADSATILMYGPDLAMRMGDLAAENDYVARGIDFFSEGADNAAAALIVTALPMVLQVIRNHEPELSSERERGIRVPFTKGKRVIRFRFRVKLGRKMRSMTNDPDKLTQHVFTNPDVKKAMEKWGITVATR